MNYFMDLTDDECKIYDSWINHKSIKTGENLFNGSKPKTNGDHIRHMTDKELAEVHTGLMINALYSPSFFYSMLKEEQIMFTNLEWLRKKVEKDD